MIRVLAKYNMEYDLEESSASFLPESVAHTRGKTIYDNLEDPLNDQGSDYTIRDIVQSMSDGAAWAESLFCSSSSYENNYLESVDDNDDHHVDSDEDDDTVDDIWPSDQCDTLDYDSYFRQYVRSQLVQNLNEGGCNYTMMERTKRFYQRHFNVPASHYISDCTCDSKILRDSTVTGEFTVRIKLRSEETGKLTSTTAIMEGSATVLFISMSIFKQDQYRHAGRSSVANMPAENVCSKCEPGVKYWLKFSDGKIVLCEQMSVS